VVGERRSRQIEASRGTWRRRRRRTPLTAQAADIAGRSMAAAVPLHRLDPRLVTGVGLLELATVGLMLVTASPLALALVAVTATVFVVLHLADQRAVLAIQEDGEASILTAGRHGRPVAVRAGSARPPELPEPKGLAAAVRVDGTRWWIDRGSYPLLVEARAATGRP
jgi:hypothetical protein